MSQLKHIIFDLGGVLINIDFDRTTQAFRDLGFPYFEKMYSQFKADQLFEKLEKGIISVDDFYTVMMSVGTGGITTNQIKMAWNSMLLDFRAESLEFLKELNKEFNLYLLSNTNAIHLEAVNQILQEQTGLESLDSFFTKSYYSHLTGFRKPGAGIFNYMLKDAGLKAEESLFIDDTKDNVLAAQTIGFRIHHLLPGERIENLVYR